MAYSILHTMMYPERMGSSRRGAISRPACLLAVVGVLCGIQAFASDARGAITSAATASADPAAAVLSAEGIPAAPVTAPSMSAPSAMTAAPVSGPAVTSPASLPAGPVSAPATTALSPGGQEESVVDRIHRGLSLGVLSSAAWLDSFFGDERYTAEANRSQVKVRSDAFREGSTGMDYRRPNFDLHLVLPQLRERYHVLVSGDPKVDPDAVVKPGSSGIQPPQSTSGGVTTALQYVAVRTAQSNISFRTGLRFHDGKVEMLAGPRYRYLLPFDPWAFRFTQEVLWLSDLGLQSRTRFDLERPLPRDLFFRTSLEGIWTADIKGYPYTFSVVLRQALGSERAVQYEWINSFQTHPTDMLTEELLVFRYRQRLWKEWLFLELAPQYRFPRDRGFDATPGILFRLEAVFGARGSIF